MAFQALPPSLHRHCTREAQKAETVLSAVIYMHACILGRMYFVEHCLLGPSWKIAQEIVYLDARL